MSGSPTQADREAAKALMLAIGADECAAAVASELYDMDVEVQAFASHRIASVSPLVEALENVRAIIAEAAMTGFRWEEGDWAERLFASQQKTSAALAKERGQ